MAAAVDIYVKTTDAVPVAIADVVVSVFDASTSSLVASAVSDATGRAAFLLPGSVTPGTEYEVRFYKNAVLFTNPARIQIIEPLGAGESNTFDVQGTLTTLPISLDPRLCRCTTKLVSFNSTPITGAMLMVIANGDYGFQNPKVVDGKLVAAQSMTFHSDSNGQVSMDLFRGGEYFVTFYGDDDQVWSIKVPDLPSADLSDLIHPEPVLLEWSSNDLSIAIGEEKVVPFTLLFSDYQYRTESLSKYLNLLNSDDSIISVEFLDNGVTPSAVIKGVAAGSATVTVQTRSDIIPTKIPAPSIEAESLNVTVTP